MKRETRSSSIEGVRPLRLEEHPLHVVEVDAHTRRFDVPTKIDRLLGQRASLRDKNLTGKAGDARLCEGDSGGPALMKKAAAVIYGINQAIDPTSGFGTGPCAGADWNIVFTNVSQYTSFIEQAVGKMCERKQVDGLDVAQCW